MVEFGLKLEDNKVSEWSEHYLNYEKLKAILKKAKDSQKKFDEQAEKRPFEVAKIMEAYRLGIAEGVSVTPSVSMASFVTSDAGSAGGDGSAADANNSTTGLDIDNDEPTERTGLLSSISPQTSLVSSVPDEKPKKKESFQKTISDIQGYFGGRYERSLRGYLKETDRNAEKFATRLAGEQKKAVDFYLAKLQELENRLAFLVDSVASSALFQRAVAGLENVDEEMSTREDVMNMEPDVTQSIRDSISRHRRVPSHLNPKQRLEDMISKLQTHLHETHFLDRLRLHKSSPPPAKDKHSKDKNPARNLRSTKSGDDSDAEDEEADDKALAEVNSIQRALIDQYRTAKLLHNFTILNYTGFVKIIKKHDKILPQYKGRFKGMLEPEALFQEGQAVEDLANRYEQYYANWFCEGDMRTAHAQMLPKKGDGLEMDWSQLRLGYRMGMCAVLALWVCWDSVWGLVSDGTSTIGGRSAFPVFRACGGILLLQWFWGCSAFIWTRYRVNYIYLFDFNPRIVATPLGIFEEAVDNTLVYMLLMLLYYKSGAHDIPNVIPDGGYPFMLVCYTVVQLIFPLRSRLPMWEAIWKVVTAPMNSSTFFHGYIGDIFTSMVKVFQDIAWTLCWVFSGSFLRSEDMRNKANFGWSEAAWYKNVLIPLLCLFPLVIRFNQCLRKYFDTGDRMPHLANAGKYALSQTVTLFGAFHPLYLEIHPDDGGGMAISMFQIFWMIVFVSSSLYSFTWDVYMDWGLGRPKHNFLGPSLMYPRRYYYYSVMAVDLVLRFMWVLTLIPPSSGARFEVPSYLTAVTMMLELFRRTIWGFFRLENEHRSNTAGFRRVGFVPLHFNTGHHHGYKDKERKSGALVLREVVLIAALVLLVCISSVVAAQRANHNSLPLQMHEL